MPRSHINRYSLVCWWERTIEASFLTESVNIENKIDSNQRICYCKSIDSSVHGLLMNFHNSGLFFVCSSNLVAGISFVCCVIFCAAKWPVGCQKSRHFFNIKTSIRHNLWLFHINYNHLLVFTMCVL